MFHIARALMIAATALGVLVVPWTQANDAGHLNREVDMIARTKRLHGLIIPRGRGGVP